jgi:hypothetical protein
MKACFVLAVGLWVIGCGTAVAGSATCIDGARVKELRMGNEMGSMGSDNGHAVYVLFDNHRTIPLNNTFNNDDRRGHALVKILLTALITGYPVRTYDHFGSSCDDFDEIWIDLPA